MHKNGRVIIQVQNILWQVISLIYKIAINNNIKFI